MSSASPASPPTAIRSVAPTTMSTHTTAVERGTHRFDVVGYGALLRHASPGDSIASSPFRVAGYDWAIRFFPAGKDDTTTDYVGLVLELLSDAPRGARARFAIDLDDDPVYYDDGEPVTPLLLGAGQRQWGYITPSRFVEARDDRVTIVCTVEVVLPGPGHPAGASAAAIAVPPPDMGEHLLRFLETERGCDVTFQVGDREFEAHRLVMAMRSPNFEHGGRRVRGRAPVRLHRRGAGGGRPPPPRRREGGAGGDGEGARAPCWWRRTGSGWSGWCACARRRCARAWTPGTRRRR
ncbi:hypothetical protein ACP4OV_023328 [Aristida adscensionis]